MPRNGSGVFSKVAGSTAVPDTEIESAKFNAVVDDFVADANAARPITAGGTGANNAASARDNLDITPENIGALPDTGGTVTGVVSVKYNGTANPGIVFLDAAGKRRAALVWVASDGSAAWLTYAADGTTVLNQLVFPGTAGDAVYNSNLAITAANLMAQIGTKATAGGVGMTQMLAHATAGADIIFGTTYAGSILRQTGMYGTSSGAASFAISGTAPSGTWRCLAGVTGPAGQQAVALFQRIA